MIVLQTHLFKLHLTCPKFGSCAKEISSLTKRSECIRSRAAEATKKAGGGGHN